MKIALVLAKSDYAVFQSPGGEIDAPLGLLQIATILKEMHEVRIFDGNLSCSNLSSQAKSTLEWQPDIVGFSVNYSTVYKTSLEISKMIRKECPDIKIIWGGNFATFFAEEINKKEYIDYIVLHEGETSIIKLIDYISGGNYFPEGVLSKEITIKEQNPCTKKIQNLDQLPFCDYSLLERPERYSKSILTSRGCPFSCIYCSTRQMWGEWRARSAKSVVDEIVSLNNKYVLSRVLFSDDNFLVDKKRAKDICQILRTQKVSVPFGFSTRLEHLDREMIEILADAQCKWLFLGIESGSNSVLMKMGRKYTVEEVLKKVRLCDSLNITCTCSFIIGLPWETENDVCKTFELMQTLPTSKVLLNIFTPLIGTPSFDHSSQYGLQINNDLNTLAHAIVGHGQVGFNTQHLTSEKIKDLWLHGQSIVVKKAKTKKPPPTLSYGGM